MSEDDAKNWDEGLRYVVRFLIKHPSIDPAVITQRLGITPSGRTWKVGTARSTVKGAPLSGLYHESAWSYSVEARDKRSFSDEVVQLLERLEPNAEFLESLPTPGGAWRLSWTCSESETSATASIENT